MASNFVLWCTHFLVRRVQFRLFTRCFSILHEQAKSLSRAIYLLCPYFLHILHKPQALPPCEWIITCIAQRAKKKNNARNVHSAVAAARAMHKPRNTTSPWWSRHGASEVTHYVPKALPCLIVVVVMKPVKGIR